MVELKLEILCEETYENQLRIALAVREMAIKLKVVIKTGMQSPKVKNIRHDNTEKNT
jgi:hypothetical protein